MHIQIENPANEAHRLQMKRLAEFVRADRIVYEDLGRGENYTLHKGATQLTLCIRGSHDQGGFLCIDTAP